MVSAVHVILPIPEGIGERDYVLSILHNTDAELAKIPILIVMLFFPAVDMI